MTEDEARAWLSAQFDVPRETWDRLERYVTSLLDEMTRQNLIAESTRDHVWARHIVDSAQLLLLGGREMSAPWIDLGSGAGLPGIVIAVLSGWSVLMVESRRKRIDFLNRVIDDLDLNARVFGGRVEMLRDVPPGAVISGRAFAPLPKLFATSAHLSDAQTLWLLPKGKNWQNELESTRQAWQGAFHVERSITDPDSAIIVARTVTRRGRT
ncbi:MAG TPA: 16S rRNA (guanine(527)-N(7))-methyltransferase RsmG [Sphingobium sp.]